MTSCRHAVFAGDIGLRGLTKCADAVAGLAARAVPLEQEAAVAS